MPYAKLTDTGGAVYGLPVVRTVNSLGSTIDVLNGKSILVSQLSPADRATIGWYDLAEEGVENIYIAGAPSDSINGTTVNRTYPAKALKPASELKQMRLAELENMADAVAFGGMVYQAAGFATDALVLSVHGLTSQVAAHYPANIRAMDGALISVNPAEYIGYRDALAEHLTNALDNRDAHAAAIDALADPQAIADYDITTGWPVNP